MLSQPECSQVIVLQMEGLSLEAGAAWLDGVKGTCLGFNPPKKVIAKAWRFRLPHPSAAANARAFV